MTDTLMHYGVKGMKWGVRRKKTTTPKKTDPPKKKKISEMTDEELQKKIDRLNLEKRYKDALASTMPKPKEKSRARKLVEDILFNSASNIGTQSVTYVMGKGANALLKQIFNDANAINPKKGQKDK